MTPEFWALVDLRRRNLLRHLHCVDLLFKSFGYPKSAVIISHNLVGLSTTF